MSESILPRESLRQLCRRKFKRTESRTVSLGEEEALLPEGWKVVKRSKASLRVERGKPHNEDLEDRLWSLFYRMGFSHISENKVSVSSAHGSLACVALDGEIALGVGCKSQKEFGKRTKLQKEVDEIANLREAFAKATLGIGDGDHRKRAIVLCMFLGNIALTESDIEAAGRAGVILFNDEDLEYYEKLVAHLGPAARFQFLADLLCGRDIPGLKIQVPAIKLKIGGWDAYMFAISPEYLLKISYVSHRSKGKGSDIDTYQRMMKRSRLRTIHDFIEDQGAFPTNIVVNIDTKRLRFTGVGKSFSGDVESSSFGWLNIRPAYKSAWIIDGQHRLFGYSGSRQAANARLAVLAFAGLKPSEQAGMFININSKQKNVKQSLLQELYSELHWEADDPRMRIRAVISKAVQSLDGDKGSPFFGKIQTADSGRDEGRCISLTAIFGALEKSDLYVADEKGGHVVEYGALWSPKNEATLKRTAWVLNNWFKEAISGVQEWWKAGSGEGGGLSMNDGVVALIGVLRSVLAHLRDDKKIKLANLNNEELTGVLLPYAKAIGVYLVSLSAEQRKQFRELRGVQGITTRQRRLQQAMRLEIPDFNPAGLEEFLRNEKAQTNKHAKDLLDKMEVILQSSIISELKAQFGKDESGWWFKGVPSQVRKEVSARFEEEAGKRGGRENYFDLIHYKTIIVNNWQIFEGLFSYGKKNAGREKGTEWIKDLNEIRKIVAHPSSGAHVSVEDLAKISSYHEWLEAKMDNPDVDSKDDVEESES